MEVHRKSVFVSFFIIVLLISSLILKNVFFEFENPTLENVLLGIVSSSVLVFIQSIISYFVERGRLLKIFYKTSVHFLNKINRMQVKIRCHDYNTIQLYDMLADVVDYYLIDFCDASCNFSFLNIKGKYKNIVNLILKDALYVYNESKNTYIYIDKCIKSNSDVVDSEVSKWLNIVNDDCFQNLIQNVAKLKNMR